MSVFSALNLISIDSRYRLGHLLESLMKINSVFDMLTVYHGGAAELATEARERALQSVLIQKPAMNSSKCTCSFQARDSSFPFFTF